MASEQRIALITGGSRGIGRATAEALAGHGTDVIITYRKDREAADDTVIAVREAGVRAAALQLDLADSGSFDDTAAKVEAILGDWGAERFDYLVNNAGMAHDALIAEVREEDFDRLYTVQVKGVFFLTQRLLPLIVDGGAIVNVSSVVTTEIHPGSAVYGMMKGALEIFTRYLAKELGERRIAVNTIAPGATDTDFAGSPLHENEAIMAELSKQIAFGRPAHAKDIGRVTAALLTGASHWVTAQRIEASGGQGL